MKKKNNLNHPKSPAMGFFFQGTQEGVRNRRSKRAIGVRATEVLLYILMHIQFYLGAAILIRLGDTTYCLVLQSYKIQDSIDKAILRTFISVIRITFLFSRLSTEQLPNLN